MAILTINFGFYVLVGIVIVTKNWSVVECFFNDCEMEPDFKDKFGKVGHDIVVIVNFVIFVIGKYIFYAVIKKFDISQDEAYITPKDFTVRV